MNVDSILFEKEKAEEYPEFRSGFTPHGYVQIGLNILQHKWNGIAGYVVQQPLKTPCYVLSKQSTQ